MYGIFTYIGVNVGKYAIHGVSGIHSTYDDGIGPFSNRCGTPMPRNQALGSQIQAPTTPELCLLLEFFFEFVLTHFGARPLLHCWIMTCLQHG